MDDLPIPESGGEAIVLLIFVAVLAGLWFLVRGTQQKHKRAFWERKKQEEFFRTHRLAEPDDPTQLPGGWEPIPEEGEG